MTRRRRRRALLALCSAFVLTSSMLAGLAGPAQAADSLPCDIYATNGTPCMAAHSTTRALYGAYAGPLYQVQRASDGARADTGLLATGGYANAGAQDAFCASTSCIITIVYDQSPRHDDLSRFLARYRVAYREPPSCTLGPSSFPPSALAQRHRHQPVRPMTVAPKLVTAPNCGFDWGVRVRVK